MTNAAATGPRRDDGDGQPPRRGSRGLGVLAAAIVAMFLTGPGQTIGVSVFIDEFVTALDITRAQVSTAYLIGTLSASLLLPIVGRQIDRFGVQRSQIVIGLVFGLALLNISFVAGIVTLTIGFFGIRLMGQGSLSLVAGVTVSLRFTKSRGTALGIFTTVAAGLLALMPVFLATAIGWVGWRDAWRLAGLVVAIVVPLLAFVALRDMPSSATAASAKSSASTDQSLNDSASDEVAVDAEPVGRSVDRNEAIRTRGFWIIAAATAASGMLATALTFHQIDVLGDIGLSKEEAAAMFLPQVVGSSIAGLSVGAAADRIGVRFLPALAGTLLVVAHLLASAVSPGVMVFAYAVVLGAAGGATNTMASTLVPLWFGTEHLGSIQGTLRVMNSGSSALGPVALALLESRLGSYPPAILVLACLAVASTLFALLPPFGGAPAPALATDERAESR